MNIQYDFFDEDNEKAILNRQLDDIWLLMNKSTTEKAQNIHWNRYKLIAKELEKLNTKE